MVSRVFPCKFLQIQKGSISSHCQHYIFKICQIGAIMITNFWRVFDIWHNCEAPTVQAVAAQVSGPCVEWSTMSKKIKFLSKSCQEYWYRGSPDNSVSLVWCGIFLKEIAWIPWFNTFLFYISNYKSDPWLGKSSRWLRHKSVVCDSGGAAAQLSASSDPLWARSLNLNFCHLSTNQRKVENRLNRVFAYENIIEK